VKRSLRLLIADDEKIEREAVRFFAEAFEPPFAAIVEAANGIEAVALARDFRPDIIIMDIKMPGQSGVEAAAQIRGQDSRARLLFLTAYGELDYARAAFKVRADDFMVKPVSGEVFREALERAILSLEEAGALAADDLDAGVVARATENDLREAIRRGLADEAERHGQRLFDLTVRADGGSQEARRGARWLIAQIERSMQDEFRREFGAGKRAADSLREVRDRQEAQVCILGAVRAFAEEIALLKTDPHRRAVDAALAFIAERWRTPITLEDASRVAGLSRFHFSRVFHAATGTTFSDYLCAKRIERAKELLTDPALPMKRICSLSGFGDPTYFSAVFKKREGMSPSEYRSLALLKRKVRLIGRAEDD